MATRSVYLHNLPPVAAEACAEAFAGYDLQCTPCAPADVIVVRLGTDEGLDAIMARLWGRWIGARPPVILAGDDASAEAFVAAAEAGVQSYVACTDPAAVAAAVRMLVETVGVYAAVNPLTGLPGSPALEREIALRLPVRGSLAVIQFDLDNFKPYSDVYGYKRGDEMILDLKRIIEGALTAHRPSHHLLVHLGGDDFFLTADVASARILGPYIVKEWDAHRAKHFNREHVRDGGFSAANRRGDQEWFPLTSVTAVMVTNEAADVTHPGQIAAILTQMKAYAKAMEGSNFVADRRQDHWGQKGK